MTAPATLAPRAPANGKPHCTSCGEVIPAHKPTCKFNQPIPKPAPQLGPHEMPPYSNPRQWSATSKHIKAAHLVRAPRTVTIAAIVRGTAINPNTGKPEPTIELRFKEIPQTLILNDICKDALIDAFGDNQDNCIGKSVELYAKKKGGKICNALRAVTSGAPAPQADARMPQAEAQTEADVPF